MRTASAVPLCGMQVSFASIDDNVLRSMARVLNRFFPTDQSKAAVNAPSQNKLAALFHPMSRGYRRVAREIARHNRMKPWPRDSDGNEVSWDVLSLKTNGVVLIVTLARAKPRRRPKGTVAPTPGRLDAGKVPK